MAKNNNSSLGFEQKLWQAADKLRSNMDASEYKHIVLGILFLKYISDAFLEKYEQLNLNLSEPTSQWYIKDPQVRYRTLEDKDEYLADNIFWVPQEARWTFLQANAKQPTIGNLIDSAMDAIERDNPSLKGVLPKIYANPGLDKSRLGELIDLIGTIGLGDKANRSKDILGRVYEYFLGQFADAEGKKGGQFYTARCVVQLLVQMIEPYKGRIFDPCCGSGGMFVQSEKFVEAHSGRLGDISIYGQESNQTTWRLCKMNLAIRGIDSKFVLWNNKGSFREDAHVDLKADFILANPPFNQDDWGFSSVENDIRWKYGKPPKGGARKDKNGETVFVDGANANYAWVQHFIHHLALTGIAGFVMSNGSMSSNTSNEGEIRKNIIEADLIDCMVALPGQLFYNTMIPVCLWFISRDKSNHRFRDRRGEVLFIDARKMGEMVDRKHRELTEDDINKISSTYHSWRMKNDSEKSYENIPGFCKSSSLDEIRKNNYILTPGRYVGSQEVEADVADYDLKIKKLVSELSQLFEDSDLLRQRIDKNLKIFN